MTNSQIMAQLRAQGIHIRQSYPGEAGDVVLSIHAGKPSAHYFFLTHQEASTLGAALIDLAVAGWRGGKA